MKKRLLTLLLALALAVSLALPAAAAQTPVIFTLNFVILAIYYYLCSSDVQS